MSYTAIDSRVCRIVMPVERSYPASPIPLHFLTNTIDEMRAGLLRQVGKPERKDPSWLVSMS